MRVNMRQFWDSLPHPRNPKAVGGWCWGSEVMTAWNYYFTQYEDYKGLLAELRFWDRANLVVTPGPNTLYIIARGLYGGYRRFLLW